MFANLKRLFAPVYTYKQPCMNPSLDNRQPFVPYPHVPFHIGNSSIGIVYIAYNA